MTLAGLIKNDLNMNVQAGNAKETIKKSISKLIMEAFPVLKDMESYSITFDLDTMYTNKSNPINALCITKDQNIVTLKVTVKNNYMITANAGFDTYGNLLGSVDFSFEEYFPDYAMLVYIIDKLKTL